MQVQSTAPVAPHEPASTVVSIFIIIAIIAAFVTYGFCGVVFARFALKQGWCAALVIIFFWLGVFLSPFAPQNDLLTPLPAGKDCTPMSPSVARV